MSALMHGRGRTWAMAAMATVLSLVANASAARATTADLVLGGIRERVQEAAALGGALSDGSPQGSEAKGVAITPDERFVMVSKPQPDGRWMISLESSSGQIQGNVLTAEGAVVFLWCDVIDAWGDGNVDDSGLVFDCSSTNDGTNWFIVATGVRVPATFFVP